MLLLIAAGIALVLSAVGLYGVVAYVVSHRRAEIGIRMALGAREAQVTGMVLGQAIVLALIGIVAGSAGSLLVTRAMQSLLFQVAPNDPVVLVSTAVLLLVVAAVASAVPARRAARVDPVEALRA
jgi:putative ABC transport system permease protein